VLHYPLLRKTVNVELTDDLVRRLESVLKDIDEILRQESPPLPVKTGYCRRCSYAELCWGSE
jgi:CRISPR-associated exonuclease Cas4